MSTLEKIREVAHTLQYTDLWLYVSVDDLLANGAVKRGNSYVLESLGQGFSRRHHDGDCLVEGKDMARLGYQTGVRIAYLSDKLTEMNIHHRVIVTGYIKVPGHLYSDVYKSKIAVDHLTK